MIFTLRLAWKCSSFDAGWLVVRVAVSSTRVLLAFAFRFALCVYLSSDRADGTIKCRIRRKAVLHERSDLSLRQSCRVVRSFTDTTRGHGREVSVWTLSSLFYDLHFGTYSSRGHCLFIIAWFRTTSNISAFWKKIIPFIRKVIQVRRIRPPFSHAVFVRYENSIDVYKKKNNRWLIKQYRRSNKTVSFFFFSFIINLSNFPRYFVRTFDRWRPSYCCAKTWYGETPLLTIDERISRILTSFHSGLLDIYLYVRGGFREYFFIIVFNAVASRQSSTSISPPTRKSFCRKFNAAGGRRPLLCGFAVTIIK